MKTTFRALRTAPNTTFHSMGDHLENVELELVRMHQSALGNDRLKDYVDVLGFLQSMIAKEIQAVKAHTDEQARLANDLCYCGRPNGGHSMSDACVPF